MNIKSQVTLILCGLILSQSLQASTAKDSKLKNQLQFIDEALNQLPKSGKSFTHCSTDEQLNNSFNIDDLVIDINRGLDEINSEITSSKYSTPSLKIEDLNKSENLDLNQALQDAIEYAKKVQNDPTGNYEVPIIKIHGMTTEQSAELNRKFKGEVEIRKGGGPGGPEMGIVGVTFVVVTGAIIGWSIHERGKDIVIPEPHDPKKLPLSQKGLQPYREKNHSSIILSFSEAKSLLDKAKLNKEK